MTTPTAFDTFGAGALAAAAAELIGPLQPATTPEPLTLLPSPAGQAAAAVGSTTRYPLVLCTLLTDLADATVTISPAVQFGATSAQPQPVVTFAPYSVAGTALVAVVPPMTQGTTTTPPFTLLAQGTLATGSAVSTLDPGELAATVRFDLVQGVLARLMTVLLDEKGKIRRAARQIRAMRVLVTATGNALNRIGADLSCPRFADELVWDAGRRSPVTQPLQPPGTTESDESYRARLRVLRGFRLPSQPWIDSVISGPDGGFLADVGFSARVTADESLDPQLLAMRLVAPGQPGVIESLLDAVRKVHLIWPAGSATGDAIHAQRLLPTDLVAAVTRQRAALATWKLPDGQPVAPALAAALAQLDDRCGQLAARPWPAVSAGQSDAGGSRFELGLGALLAAPVAALLDAAVNAATELNDPALVPRPRSVDPAGAWLLNACGLRTVEQGADGTVFVSPALMGPLVVDVDPGPEDSTPLTLSARLVSAADPNHDVPMVSVIQALATEQLTPVPAPATLLAGAQPVTAVAGLADALATRDLTGVTDVASFVRQLASVSPRDYAIFDLGATRTAAVIATPALLSPLFTTATQAGASSVVALATGTGTLALMFGVAGMPVGGANLAAQHTVIHRWQARALGTTAADVQPRRGPVVRIAFPSNGITLVSCLVSQRDGANEPYTWRPALPDGALLTLRQYEHLLNVVQLVTPVGVRADTFAIRTQHVDVDGTGKATFLTPTAARSYRQYRLTRSAQAGQGVLT